MKLQETIKQNKPFKNEFHKLIVNISVTSSWLNLILAERLKPFGISPHQFNVLRILNGKHPDGYCNQEITERMIDKSSNATRIVDKLIEKKFAVRTENAGDRRLVDIKITDKGIKLLAEIEKAPFPAQLKRNAFNEEKAKLMNEWLDELRS